MNLFLDCDGVLADFDKKAAEILGLDRDKFEIRKFTEGKFWDQVYAYPDFFYSLDPMPDAFHLWESTQHLNPTILTGVPRGGWAADQKVRWAKKHFGEDVQIITCMSANKSDHMKGPGDILVDDWPKYKHVWEAKGGIFVEHTNSISSLQELKRLRPEWF